MMTSSSLNLAWPACQKCSAHVDDITRPGSEVMVDDEREVEGPDACFRGHGLGLNVNRVARPLATPPGLGASCIHPVQHPQGGVVRLESGLCENVSVMFPGAAYRKTHQWNVPSEDEESLEPPFPLCSDVGEREHRFAPPGLTRSRT